MGARAAAALVTGTVTGKSARSARAVGSTIRTAVRTARAVIARAMIGGAARAAGALPRMGWALHVVVPAAAGRR